MGKNANKDITLQRMLVSQNGKKYSNFEDTKSCSSYTTANTNLTSAMHKQQAKLLGKRNKSGKFLQLNF